MMVMRMKLSQKNGVHKPAGPYRGWKTDVYEGGTRVPFIVTWPGKIKPGVSSAMVNQMDFLASFSSFFKQSIPSKEAKDSENMWSAFTGNSNAGRSTMVEQGYSNLAVVNGDWKYIPPFGKLSDQLYNLKEDVAEE
jgi:arylsulfatase A